MGKVKRTAIDQIELMRNLLAFLLVGAFIAVLPLFAFVIIPDQNKDVIVYMVGQLSGMAVTVLGFYFVSKVGQDALDAKRSDNTAKAFETIQGLAGEGAPADAKEAADDMVEAAEDKADEIKGSSPKRKGGV